MCILHTSMWISHSRVMYTYSPAISHNCVIYTCDCHTVVGDTLCDTYSWEREREYVYITPEYAQSTQLCHTAQAAPKFSLLFISIRYIIGTYLCAARTALVFCTCVCVRVCVSVCVSVCVRERERERERAKVRVHSAARTALDLAPLLMYTKGIFDICALDFTSVMSSLGLFYRSLLSYTLKIFLICVC